MRSIVLGLVLAAIAEPTGAWSQTPPDPATITLPDLSSANDPRNAAEGWKYFYFHKQGVSYEKAYADFSECYRFLPVWRVEASLPMFAPWEETPGSWSVPSPVISQYGIVGDLIGLMVAGPVVRRAYQSRMRRCLETRSYVRYPLAKDAWEQLIDNYSPRSIALQAKAAAAAAPHAEIVTR